MEADMTGYFLPLIVKDGRELTTVVFFFFERDPPEQGRGPKTSRCSPMSSALEVGLKWLIFKE